MRCGAVVEPERGSIPCVFHAEQRMRQRGVRRETLDFVLDHADRVLPAGGGAETLFLTCRRLDDLRRHGIAATLIERARRLTVVVSGDGAVVTLYRRDQNHRPPHV